MEFQLTGRSDRYFQAPSAGLENRQNSRVSEKPAEMGSRKSLGQAFLKACGCPEGKALGLQEEPTSKLSQNSQSVTIHVVLPQAEPKT